MLCNCKVKNSVWWQNFGYNIRFKHVHKNKKEIVEIKIIK
jgi:hypothetical protein